HHTQNNTLLPEIINGGLCMQGRIYTKQKCFECQKSLETGILKYIENKGFLQCPKHPDISWAGSCEVRFGRKHHKRFKSVKEAERHLNHIRYQADNNKGGFDQREWAKSQPLSFLSLREKFVSFKTTQSISPKQVRHITRVLELAGKSWDLMQIKEITEGEIDDFFLIDHGVGNKTLANWKTVLHDFWKWIVRREKRRSKLEMPEFPEIKFELEMKKIVNMEDQQDIIEEVRRISWEANPRIWLGIRLMSWYPKVRPGEMLNLQEGHINCKDNWIVFPQPKEKKPKFIHLLPEHSKIIQEIQRMIPSALPDMFFFRHLKTKSGVKAGVKFGPKYFNIWWKKACKNLGISGVSVYPGVKHSTVTALGTIMSPEEIQHDVTGHVSDAFKRYFLPDVNRAVVATRKLSEMQDGQHVVNISNHIKSSK
ncbi:site-specific integrase, partial [Desulfobacterales bacterium HSG17]|nr:site-specific integrase [Desulfobacterales bacterium HSG17]